MRFVLYKPLYDINVGKVCRVIKNFGIDELYIVCPKARLGFTARKYAKHGLDVLENAKIVETFEEATENCYPILGTTANRKKGSKQLANLVNLRDIAKKQKQLSNAAIVFGSEDTGLPVEVLEKCDFNVFIETCEQYTSLNLAVAAGIIAYMLCNNETIDKDSKTSGQIKRIASKYFDMLVDSVEEKLKNKGKCKKAFRNIIIRSNAEEINSILCVLKELCEHS